MITSLPKIWLLAPASSFLAILIAFILFRKLLTESEGTPRMKEIAGYVKEGAMAYLKKQYKVVAVVFAVIFCILGYLSYIGVQSPFVPFIFLSGGFWSAFAGYLGMKTATNASARTANACQKSLNSGLKVSFRGGAIMGLLVVGFGLFDLSVWFFALNWVYDSNTFNLALSLAQQNSTLFEKFSVDGAIQLDSITNTIEFQRLKLVQISNALLTYAMGASFMALFARVGGGIYTKAADVGADLVGKVEFDIPEDDPRNPATIADNVGDNVGDVSGMGADLFESYCGSILAAVALGASLVVQQGSDNLMTVFSPMVVAAGGILASIIGIFVVKTKENATQKQLLHSLLIGTGFASVLFIGFAAYIASISLISWDLFISVVIGLVAGFIIGQATEYYTSDTYKPTQLIAKSAEDGPATGILSGISTGMVSAFIPVLVIVTSIVVVFVVNDGSENIYQGVYAIAFAAIGMLSTLGIQLATDAFGPIADNAGGNAEMAELDSSVRSRTDALDSLGNTTAATGKGFAIGSAALTALALIAAYLDAIIQWMGRLSVEKPFFISRELAVTSDPYGYSFAGTEFVSVSSLSIESIVSIFQINILNPKFLCGIFIGAAVAFLFCGLTISAVRLAASDMVQEVRRQFREIKGILEGKATPDYAQCVSISTEGALKQIVVPSLIAIFTPIIVGIYLNISGVIGLLCGALTCGLSLAIFLNNSGGSWDNAKKYIEAGNNGGKGSDTHKAAVIGDTVGDPFKDTSGPALNILIKLMTIVSVVFAGVILKFGM